MQAIISEDHNGLVCYVIYFSLSFIKGIILGYVSGRSLFFCIPIFRSNISLFRKFFLFFTALDRLGFAKGFLDLL